MGKKNRSKKSKGGAKAGGSSSNSRAPRASAAAGGGFANVSTNSVPAFQNNRGSKDAPKVGMYDRYKKATSAVKDFLKSKVSSVSSDGALVQVAHVNDLSRAAERIMHHVADDAAAAASVGSASAGADPPTTQPDTVPIEIPKDVLEELEVSIKLREQVGEMYGPGGGDSGHKYMVDTLKHVRRVLMVTRKISKIAKKTRRAQSGSSVRPNGSTRDADSVDAADASTSIGGKFSALVVDDEEDSDDDMQDDGEIPTVDEDMVRSGNLPDMSPPEASDEQKKLSIEEDLIKGDDRFQATLFLQSLDMFMMSIDQHFDFLKKVMRKDPSVERVNCDSVLQLLMECNIAVNYAINSVRQMEAVIEAEHEHLSSFYHILAVVVLSEFIETIQSKLSDDIRRNRPHLATKFVGDILQRSFYARSASAEGIPSIVRRFVKTSKLKHAFVENVAKAIQQGAEVELMLPVEVAQNSWMFDDTRKAIFAQRGIEMPTPHSWLRGYYIGKDRNILNTQRLTQQILGAVQKNTKLVSKGEIFGPLWNESTRLAKKIEGDLNAVLCEHVLPELIEICKQVPVRQLPGHRELMPLLDTLSEQLQETDRPVRISLTMGLHSILTSIFVLQGDHDVSKLAQASKQTWEKLFRQIEAQAQTDLPTPPHVLLNLNLFKEIVRLAEPVGPVSSPAAESLAFWSPVCAGTFLLFGTYSLSIGLGSATVDAFAQLRFTLHLFNSLKDQGLVSKDLALVSNLERAFKKAKAIWPAASPPDKGEYIKSFLMAWGQSASDASKKAEMERQLRLGAQSNDIQSVLNFSETRGTTRDLVSLNPEDFSSSYRRLVLHDFSNAIDDYSIRNCTEKDRSEYALFLDFVSHVNLIRDAVDDDEKDVLLFNFVVVGGVLNQFIVDLSREMAWDEMIRAFLATQGLDRQNVHSGDGRRLRGFAISDESYERTGLVAPIASFLGELDFTDGPYSEAVQKAAKFMEAFFSPEKEKLCEFMVEPFAECIEEDSAPTNPLLGNYAYGRSGRTANDPLRAFMFFKHTKKGELRVRLIKPGKKTQYVTSDGETVAPYDAVETTSFKLPVKSNGRYRHIAGYSLKELIDMGWDGAKYNSTTIKSWVPYVPGYDSDSDDEYEQVNLAEGKRQGLIGLTEDDVGLRMDVAGQKMVVLRR